MPVVTRNQAKQASQEIAGQLLEKRNSKKGKKQVNKKQVNSKIQEDNNIELVIEEKVGDLKLWFNNVYLQYLQAIEENKLNIWSNKVIYNINRIKLWTELLYHIRIYSEITGHINALKYNIINDFMSAISESYIILMRGIPPRNKEEATAYKAFQSEAKLTTEFLSKFANQVQKEKIDNINLFIQGISNMLNIRRELEFN